MTQDEIIEMAQECRLIGMRPHLDGIYSESLVAFAKLVDAKATAREREEITQEFWICLMSDLEHGIKSLNEKATIDFHKHMPALADFGAWLEKRGNK